MFSMYKKIFVAVVAVFGILPVYASSQPNSMYFMHDLPYKMYMNPALQPDSVFDTFVELPVISSTYVGVNTGGLSMSDVLQLSPAGTLVPFTNPDFQGKDEFYNSLSNNTRVNVDFSTAIFGFGFRLKEKGYLSFNLSLRGNGVATISKDAFSFLLYGTPDPQGVNYFDCSTTSAIVNTYMDFSGGYSRKIGDKWKVGGRIHVLTGLASANASFDELSLAASTSQWTFTNRGTMQYSIPGMYIILDENGKINGVSTDMSDIMSSIGGGLAFDLGAEFRPIDGLSVSLSFADLGFLYYKGMTMSSNSSASFEGEEIDDFDEFSVNVIDSIAVLFTDGFTYEQRKDNFANMLNAKMYIAAEYSFLRDMMSVGLLSKTEFNTSFVEQEITLAYTVRPCRWFGFLASYSFFSGGFNTLGLGIDFSVPGLNLYVVTDYLPMYYSAEGIPYRSSAFNVQAGLVMTFGGRWSKNKK